MAKLFQEAQVTGEGESACWPEQPHADQLADYGLTAASVAEMEYEEFEQTCALLAAADSVLLFKLLGHFGYDYWLQQRAFATPRNPKQSQHFNTALLERLKEFVEVSFCQEKQVIQALEPYQLRLLSKAQSSKLGPGSEDARQEEEPGEQDELKAGSPLGYFDDSMFALNARQAAQHGDQHWFSVVSQAEVSNLWALIKTFSRYFAIAVPFIDCSTSIAANPQTGAIPITLSAYMSSLRTLCLSNTKYELKHLILE